MRKRLLISVFLHPWTFAHGCSICCLLCREGPAGTHREMLSAGLWRGSGKRGRGPNLWPEQPESFPYGALSLTGCKQREKGKSSQSTAMGLRWQPDGTFPKSTENTHDLHSGESLFKLSPTPFLSPFASSLFHPILFIFNFSCLISRYFWNGWEKGRQKWSWHKGNWSVGRNHSSLFQTLFNEK